MALPAASRIMVWSDPPFTVYVTVAFGVPENVMTDDDPEQIESDPDIAAVGNGETVIDTDPLCVWLQAGIVAETTLTRLYVVSAVKT